MISALLSGLPRREHPIDPLLGLGFCPLIVSLGLLTPCTLSWNLFRAAVVFPLAISYCILWGYYTWKDDHILQWSVAAGSTFSIIRASELLIFYPAEENVYRLRPAPGPSGEGDQPELLPEPTPSPWTWKKWGWGMSLWWCMRGIGWNYTCGLPPSCRRRPFSRTSTRGEFVLNRTIHFIGIFLLTDLARSWMNLGPDRGFFDGRRGLHDGYESFAIWQRAVNSLCIAIRIKWTIENVYYPASVVFMAIGALTGWKGEYWEPWGWPPMFGRIDETWANPGFSNLWSKLWHQYYRRWLYVFGWLGIGEKILGLPHSGLSSRPLPIPAKKTTTTSNGTTPHLNGKLSPPSAAVSGRASPTHPVPTIPTASTPTKRTSPGMIIGNFVKSLIVFFLCGCIHDFSNYHLLRKYRETQGRPFKWTDAIATLPFFVAQPFALAAEAIIKNIYRRWKTSVWKSTKPPAILGTLERTVAFVAVWWWMGWTAHWFVIGLTQAGMFRRDESQDLAPSLVGGLVWGKWMH